MIVDLDRSIAKRLRLFMVSTHPRASGDKIVASYQALRAVAVLFVVINHIFPQALRGGYIGVDVFFVVSGFLITGHLLDEIEGRGLSFATFYARRARRLLPAALLVAAATAAASWFLLPPARVASAMKDIAAAAVYGINWRLALTSVDYFAEGGAAAPATHFWSLSVEEQFYLVWPALLVAATRIGRGRWGGSVRARVGIALGALFALSFAAATLPTGVDKAALYFHTHARAWEFSCGGLAALLVRSGAMRSPRRRPEVLLAWAVLAASGWLLDAHSGVPGVAALPAVLATAVVLTAGDGHGFAPLGRIVALRPVQWTGDVSYSLYLWHWPLIVFLPPLLGDHLPVKAIGWLALALSFGASALTKPLVEDRFRFPRTAFWRRPATALVLLVVSASLAGVLLLGAQAVTRRAAAVAQTLYDLSRDPAACFGGRAGEAGADCPTSHRLADRDFVMQSWSTQIVRPPSGQPCQNAMGDVTLQPCTFGPAQESEVRLGVALLGDSHAGMWASALIELIGETGLRTTMYVASSCAATLDPLSNAYYLPPDKRAGCRAWREAAIEAIAADPAIAVVVASGNANNQRRLGADGVWQSDDGSGFARAWERLLAAGKRVVVIDDVPELPSSLPECLARTFVRDDPCSHRDDPARAETPLARAARTIDHPAFRFVSFREVFCDGVRCHAVIGGIPAYMDADHISAPMARSLARRLLPALKP